MLFLKIGMKSPLALFVIFFRNHNNKLTAHSSYNSALL